MCFKLYCCVWVRNVVSPLNPDVEKLKASEEHLFYALILDLIYSYLGVYAKCMRKTTYLCLACLSVRMKRVVFT